MSGDGDTQILQVPVAVAVDSSLVDEAVPAIVIVDRAAQDLVFALVEERPNTLVQAAMSESDRSVLAVVFLGDDLDCHALSRRSYQTDQQSGGDTRAESAVCPVLSSPTRPASYGRKMSCVESSKNTQPA